jgi:hypothetical protein
MSLPENETDELLFELEYRGFRFCVDDCGRLLVFPGLELNPADRLAINRHLDGLVRIVCDRDDLIPSFSPLFQKAFRKVPGSPTALRELQTPKLFYRSKMLGPFGRAAAKPIKRKENSMQPPDTQLPLFVGSDPRAKKRPPSSS